MKLESFQRIHLFIGVVEINEKNIILLENYMNEANDIMKKYKTTKKEKKIFKI